MELTFIELASFTNNWKKHRLTDEDLQALQDQFRQNPLAGDVIRGTGGVLIKIHQRKD